MSIQPKTLVTIHYLEWRATKGLLTVLHANIELSCEMVNNHFSCQWTQYKQLSNAFLVHRLVQMVTYSIGVTVPATLLFCRNCLMFIIYNIIQRGVPKRGLCAALHANYYLGCEMVNKHLDTNKHNISSSLMPFQFTDLFKWLLTVLVSLYLHHCWATTTA